MKIKKVEYKGIRFDSKLELFFYLELKKAKIPFQFQKKYTFQHRLKEATSILKKYDDRVPIIVEKNINSDVPDLDKHKYLVPKDVTFGQFIYVLRRRIKLNFQNHKYYLVLFY